MAWVEAAVVAALAAGEVSEAAVASEVEVSEDLAVEVLAVEVQAEAGKFVELC